MWFHAVMVEKPVHFADSTVPSLWYLSVFQQTQRAWQARNAVERWNGDAVSPSITASQRWESLLKELPFLISGSGLSGWQRRITWPLSEVVVFLRSWYQTRVYLSNRPDRICTDYSSMRSLHQHKCHLRRHILPISELQSWPKGVFEEYFMQSGYLR